MSTDSHVVIKKQKHFFIMCACAQTHTSAECGSQFSPPIPCIPRTEFRPLRMAAGYFTTEPLLLKSDTVAHTGNSDLRR